MSSEIKPGDLVMVVRPNICCGASDSVGVTGIASEVPHWAIFARCDGCGDMDYETGKYVVIHGGGHHVSTLKKLEPPASQETRPCVNHSEVA